SVEQCDVLECFHPEGHSVQGNLTAHRGGEFGVLLRDHVTHTELLQRLADRAGAHPGSTLGAVDDQVQLAATFEVNHRTVADTGLRRGGERVVLSDLDARVVQDLADRVAEAVHGAFLAVDLNGDVLVHRELRRAAPCQRQHYGQRRTLEQTLLPGTHV